MGVLLMAQLFKMAHPVGGIQGHVATAPPAGSFPVTNVYWDDSLNKMVVEYDDSGGTSGTIQTDPPVGKFAITNIYFDPSTGKMVGEHDDGA